MNNQSTKKVFEGLTQNSISEGTLKEIEQNLKNYFTTLIEWLGVIDKKEDKQGDE